MSRHRLSRLPVVFLSLLPAACSQQDKKARVPEAAVVGVWESDTLTAGPSAPAAYRLQVRADGMAELVRHAMTGRDSAVQRGTWDGADSLLRVVVRGEAATSRATSILLAVRGSNTLGQVQFDSAQWGNGLAFHRR